VVNYSNKSSLPTVWGNSRKTSKQVWVNRLSPAHGSRTEAIKKRTTLLTHGRLYFIRINVMQMAAGQRLMFTHILNCHRNHFFIFF